MNKENAENFRKLLRDTYGPNPPLVCQARLEAEIMLLPASVVDELYLTCALRKAAGEQCCDIDIEADYGASLIYYLTGCSNINPLPPHYFCRKCGRMEIVSTVEDGWDLPEKTCCGSPMLRAGSGIPLEMMKARRYAREKTSVYVIPNSFKERAGEVVEQYYRDKYPGKYYVVPYLTELEQDGRAELKSGFVIVNRNPPEDGLYLALVPAEDGMPELDEDGVWQLPYEVLHDKDYRTVRFRCSRNKEVLGKLMAKNKVMPAIQDLLEEDVMEALSYVIDRSLNEDSRVLPVEADPLTFSFLRRKKAYLQDEETEENPALENPQLRYTDLFSCREDVWKLLDEAFPAETNSRQILIEQITDDVSKGRYCNERMSNEMEQLLKDLGIDEYWITQMKHTHYLRSKASLINDVVDDLYYFWSRKKAYEMKYI